MNGDERADGTSGEEIRRRRAWILANHPDRGGDPHEFAAGLDNFDHYGSPTGRTAADDPGMPKVTVYRSRSPLRRLNRLVRSVRRSSRTGSRSRRVL